MVTAHMGYKKFRNMQFSAQPHIAARPGRVDLRHFGERSHQPQPPGHSQAQREPSQADVKYFGKTGKYFTFVVESKIGIR